ncbi:peptide ABC transporter substrate-binding protein [Brachybacterium endophyticum]|uniref:Peptide ABC transporter substrate-binding protein n=1 Tax=Brachybacterium endophyticum TaxID=2182385 RepID=A0A2U2RPC6_9MICO|nr:ABC transporter family substrate-binding protein [Brachybacterium endophyticum]PWH07691.1 peptide ABC transporter substrate-binding protein [Brachybacterium endophyticum]
MRFTRRSMLGATALSVTGVALVGCSKDTGQGGGSGGDSGNDSVAADALDINAKDRGDLGEGGVLRLTNNAFPANWNRYSLDGNETNTAQMCDGVLYPLLVVSNEKGEISANEAWAKRIELTSEDPQVMEVELQPDMKWSDGTPIDYKSIENVFTVMSGKKKGYNISSSEGYNLVEKVEQGSSDLIAKISFKSTYADWMGLAGVLPDSAVESPQAFNEGYVSEPKVTAGPFKVGKIDTANKTVLLERDDNWWGEKPPLDQVLFTTIEDPSAAATSFQNGQLDAIEPSVPAVYSVVKPLVGKGNSLRKSAGPEWSHITLNGSKGRPLEDVKVRQAVFRAIDRQEVFLSVNSTMPYPKDFPPLGNHILMPNQDGYKDNSGDLGKHDVDAAKKLLEEAGYTFEGEEATKDGKQLELTYVYNDGSKTNEAVVPVVEEALKAVGIKMKVQKVPPTDLFSKYISQGDYDLTLFGYTGGVLLSGNDGVWKQKGESNYAKVGSKEIDDLVGKASAEIDEAKRLDLVNELDAKLWEIAGLIPLWQSYSFWVQNDDLANFGARGFKDLDWTLVGYVKGSDKLKG